MRNIPCVLYFDTFHNIECHLSFQAKVALEPADISFYLNYKYRRGFYSLRTKVTSFDSILTKRVAKKGRVKLQWSLKYNGGNELYTGMKGGVQTDDGLGK